jgi:opacity protein-like surface antigen
MKKIVSFIIISVLALGTMQAQDKPGTGYMPHSYYTFSWNQTYTLGDFNKWVDKASLAGFDIGGRYFVMKGLTAGFNISWQRVSADYTNQTYTIPDKGIAITADNYRSTWMVPFQAVVAYHFIPTKMISPYIGLGIGGDYMEHHLLIQEYDIYKEVWDFSLTPEVGALVKFGPYSNMGAIVAFNYKWTTNKIEVYETTSKNLSMLNLKIGLAYIIR